MTVKPNYLTLGPSYGKFMRYLEKAIANLTPRQIAQIRERDTLTIIVEGETIELRKDDVIITD